jgi:hypothetical protein
LHTGFIDGVVAAGLMEEEPPSPEEEHVAMLAAALHASRHQAKESPAPKSNGDWKDAGRAVLLNQWPARAPRRNR